MKNLKKLDNNEIKKFGWVAQKLFQELFFETKMSKQSRYLLCILTSKIVCFCFKTSFLYFSVTNGRKRKKKLRKASVDPPFIAVLGRLSVLFFPLWRKNTKKLVKTPKQLIFNQRMMSGAPVCWSKYSTDIKCKVFVCIFD